MWDVIVIGAGVVGCAAARALSRYKLKVLVLERGNDICSGTSKGNSAMVHAGYDPEPGSLKAIFNAKGNAMFDELCAELAVNFERSGTMLLATTEEEIGELRRLEKLAEQNGVPVEILDRAALKERQPAIGDGVLGALYAPTGGMVCPYGLVIAMAEHANLNGVEFRTGTEAIGFERIPNGWRVHAANTSFDTRLVFNCAGVFADELNNMVSERKLRITPRFGSHILLDREYIPYVNTTIGQTPSPLPTGGHTKGMAIEPSVDGTVILGCDAEDYEDKDDLACTARSLKRITDYFERVWPLLPISKHVGHFPYEGVIGAYGGLRAHPDTDDFVIGEVFDAPGFINAAGIESPGLTAGPAIGEHLAELAVEKLRPEPNENYRPGRNALPRFREMTMEQRREAIRRNPDYGKIVCRCEQVTEAEIRDAIRRPLGARSINGVKMRTRAGMGRCQGGFCGGRVLQILCEELGLDPLEVTQAGGDSFVLAGKCCSNRLQEAQS